MKNLVGRRVREARLSKLPKMTQEALAGQLQLKGITIDRAGIAKIENGFRQVSDVELSALAQSLSVPVGWLMNEASTGDG